MRCWVLTRIEDIQAVLNDTNFMATEPSKYYADLARRAGRNYDPTIRVLDATSFSKMETAIGVTEGRSQE